MTVKHYGKVCFHCGHDYAIHHYETMQCPKGGEATGDIKQEWLKTTFVPLALEPVIVISNKEYIVQFKDSRQVSPDDWENYTPTLKINGATTIKEIQDWYDSFKYKSKLEMRLIEL